MHHSPLRLSVALSILLGGLMSCGDNTEPAPAASPETAGGVAMAASPTQPRPIVETHARGVFFDAAGLRRQAASIAAASGPAAAGLQPVEITDTTGFGAPLTAATISVPRGWMSQGGVEWNRGVECAGNTHAFNWTASSPDGMHQISLLPKFTWQVESAPGGIVPLNPCPAAPMRSAREFLEFLAGSARRNFRVLDYRERPELVAALQSGAAQTGASMAGIRYDAGELLIGYSLQGHEMRETLVAAVTFSEMQGSVVAWSDTAFALRAPDGLLDFDALERIRQSFVMNRPWGEQMLAWTKQHIEAVNQRQVQSIQEWHNRRMSEINMAGMAARHQIRMDTLAQIGRINSQIVAGTAATNDRAHAAFIDAIQEVQPWRDPSTGSQVDLSIHYSNAWQLADGRQFLTNDPSFDPQRDLGLAGHRLEAVR